MEHTLWLVSLHNIKVVVWALNREEAKRRAHSWIGAGNPDQYTVTPLTEEGDRVHLHITLNI